MTDDSIERFRPAFGSRSAVALDASWLNVGAVADVSDRTRIRHRRQTPRERPSPSVLQQLVTGSNFNRFQVE